MAEPVNVEDVVEGAVNPAIDSRGRTVPELMSDREILIETLHYMRTMMDLFEAMGNHPMAQTLGMAFPARR
jgi:hypothetical protein